MHTDRKFFGSTYYVNIGKDVQENEKYISCDVISQWDWSDQHPRWYGNNFTYRVYEECNHKGRKYLSQADLSDSELKKVIEYINK